MKLLCFIYSVECVALNACSCVTSVVLLLPPSLSLTAPLHDGECLTVPEDKGGSRDTLDDQIGERETEEVRQEATAATKDP